jgi:hypothetical protein
MFGFGSGVALALLQCLCAPKLWSHLYNLFFLWGGKH